MDESRKEFVKKYIDKNVYESLIERIHFIFDEFERPCISVSGGKDSSLLFQIMNQIAKERNRAFDAMYIDLEAGYKMTAIHMEELKAMHYKGDFYHFCLPITEFNGLSIFQPAWTVWNPKKKDLWIKPMPDDAITIDSVDPELFKKGDEWEELLSNFPVWLKKKHGLKKVACLLGLRADESLNRFRSVAFAKNMYQDINWSTKMRKDVYNFSPIYDWRTEDIWTAVGQLGLRYNEVYELMWKNGISIHDQRICQPFGQEQKAGLDQFALIEPETWVKIVERVGGVNFGAIYCKTSLLGHNGSQKPEHLTWQEYAIFLLETMEIYSPLLTRHYVRKLNILFDYIKTEEGMQIKDIQESHERIKFKNNQEWLSWERIAKTIEKNDFQCGGLQYGLTNADRDEMILLQKEFGKFLGIENYKIKSMQKLAKELGYEG
ncbi:MAG: DUF3440 domain-containing protein [Bacteroidota bacterium]